VELKHSKELFMKVATKKVGLKTSTRLATGPDWEQAVIGSKVIRACQQDVKTEAATKMLDSGRPH